MTASWINLLASQQDYLWFIVTLSWSLAGVVWWYDWRHQPHRRWVPYAIIAGIATGIVELIAGVSVANYGFKERFHEAPDFLLGLSAALEIGAWYYLIALGAKHRFPRIFFRACALLIIVSAATRAYENLAPLGASAITVSAIAVYALRSRLHLHRGDQLAFALVIAAIPLGSWANVAEYFHVARRWTEINPFGLISAVVQLAAALLVLVSVMRSRMIDLFRDNAAHTLKEWKVFLPLVTAWIVAGMALAWLAAENTRRTLETSLEAQARIASLTLDASGLEHALGQGISINRRALANMPNGAQSEIGYSDKLAAVDTTLLETELARLEALMPNGADEAIVTIADGKMVGCIFSPGKTRKPGKLSIREDVSESERQAWQNRKGRFLGLTHTPWGDRVSVWAPLASGSKMLGWLEMIYPVGMWAASQAQARWQTFAITGLGVVVGTLVFIQRLRSRERMIIASQAQAAESANALKTAFLAKVSHELRTPIQTVLGYGEWLEREAQAERDRIRAAALRQHAELMLRLVTDLLDLGAIETGVFRLSKKVFSPIAIVAHAVTSLKPRAETKGVSLQWKSSEDLPNCAVGDPDRFNQIVINLVGNAVKYTDDGSIEVSLSCENSLANVHRLLLVVADTGPGLTEAQQALLFQPFVRLENQIDKEGTGLGLSLVAGLCRQMDGSITVQSQPGEGSRFEARMSLGAAQEKHVDYEERTRLDRRTVLIAEDNTLVRELFVDYLKESGAHCITAENGEKAVELILAGGIDVVLLDLSLPKLSGLGVARRVRNAAKPVSETFIIGVSAHASVTDQEAATAAGMNAFFAKPVSMPKLAKVIGAAGSAALTGLDALKMRLRTRFAAEVHEQVASVQSAIDARDWLNAGSRCHYLKNSAAAVEALELYDACGELENRIAEGEATAVEAAWRTCLVSLYAWQASAAPLTHIESNPNQTLNHPSR